VRFLCIHAHFDDYEFACAGTFELCRRRLGSDFQARLVVCTDGAAGHHARTREETSRIRLAEQQASTRLGQYEFELLRLQDGRVPREGCLEAGRELLAALWKSIRDFEPDYLFCPPLPADPLAGVHVDHLVVAEAVRRVAYMINVPHAFTPEYPADETASRPCKTPVILNLFDSYLAGTGACDFAIDTEAVFPLVCEMSWSHQSQIREWLPWVGRHNLQPPATLEEWSAMLRRRFVARNRAMGTDLARALEFFTVTSWGSVPAFEQILADFPEIALDASRLVRMEQRLAQAHSI
jgi:LmbE family N-acetylglucosaminyl deacetylase